MDALYKEGRESSRGVLVALQGFTADPRMRDTDAEVVVDKVD
jgi:hypothetical protein